METTTPQRLSRPLLTRAEGMAIALLLGLPFVTGLADANSASTDAPTMSADTQTTPPVVASTFWTLDEQG